MRKCGREWAALPAPASRQSFLWRKRIESIRRFWTKRSRLSNSRGPAAKRLTRSASVDPPTSASESKDISTNFILILIWFGLRYLPSMSLTEPDRSEVVAWGLAECGTILWLSLNVSLECLKSERVFAVRTRPDKIIFQLLGVWFGACGASAVLGIARGNE